LSFIVLRLDFDIEDLAALRFAISPLAESVSALRVYASATDPGPHRAWLTSLGAADEDSELALLVDLVPAYGYSPDFLTPPLRVPVGDFDAELAVIRGAAPEIVRSELELTFAGRTMPSRVQALHADPTRHLPKLADVLARWHALAIRPHWQRLHAMLAAEIGRQSRALAEHGPGHTLANLHPSIRWRSTHLMVDMRWEARISLSRRGLLLVPSAFWHGVGPIVLGSGQPTLLYPAAGVELVWEPRSVPRSGLAEVIGRTRARLLEELDEPITTTQLALRLGLTPPGVSQHLQRLRDAGLATAVRDGREVRYRRTPLAAELLEAATGPR
jgi:DNA-binding transcriptional ArsR family regulator